METAQNDMQEKQELQPQKPLEATYVTIVKDIVAKKIPEHQDSFNIALDEINKQITGKGLFQWESRENPDVKFLAGHLSVTPDLIEKIVGIYQEKSGLTNQKSQPEDKNDAQKDGLEHYVYIVQPSFGMGRDGSALSA